VQELTAVCQLAAAHDVPTFTHVAYMSRIDPESAAEAYIRLIGCAGVALDPRYSWGLLRLCLLQLSSR
jgi:hypothetical protein